MTREAKTAKDINGDTVRVGDSVEAMDIYSGEWSGRIVKVAGIHRQGYDGTILTCTPAPIAEFPHHYTHQASKTRRIKETEGSCLNQIPHSPADDDEIEGYARGLLRGTLKSATPNVVASLLTRIREHKQST